MSKKKSTEDFIHDAMLIHGDRYDYSIVDYKGNNINVDIICKIHGVFNQTPISHINKKCGCPDCSNNRKMTTELFIKKAKLIHGDVETR